MRRNATKYISYKNPISYNYKIVAFAIDMDEDGHLETTEQANEQITTR
jgi:hypothetical protein